MQEISLENLPRHKHEYWVLEGMLPLGGGVIKRKVAIRPKLECDAIIRMELPDIFWGELAGWIDYYRPGQTNRPRREPCLVVFTHALPLKLIKTGFYKPFGVPGIYVGGTEELALELLVVTSRLPKDPKYNWLRRCGRAPEATGGSVMDELRETRELTTIEEERVMEATMTIEADSRMSIKELAKETVRLQRAMREMNQVQQEKDQVLQQ